jgi:hypothetical protein
MTTSAYFSKGTAGEQALYEALIIEQLQVFGHDVYYLPRKLVAEDTLWGEDVLSSFNDAYQIEMYMEEVEGFGGEKELISKFGLEIRDEANFVVARSRWDTVVSSDTNLIESSRPNEGDLIYFPRIKKLFQIDFVDHDDPFYQVDNLPVYKLSCSTFEYSSEDLDTGIAAIDAIEDTMSLDALEYQLLMENGDTMITEDGDYIISEEYRIDTIAQTADNLFIERTGDTILDFTESNPFGDPGGGSH